MFHERWSLLNPSNQKRLHHTVFPRFSYRMLCKCLISCALVWWLDRWIVWFACFVSSCSCREMVFIFGVWFFFHKISLRINEEKISCCCGLFPFFLFLQHSDLFKFAFNIYSLIRRVLYFLKTNFPSNKVIRWGWGEWELEQQWGKFIWKSGEWEQVLWLLGVV